MTALVRLALESGSSGQVRRASSGHCRSAVLCVKKMVGRPKSVDHGEQSTALTEPVLLGAAQTGCVVQHTIGESFPLSSHHVTKLVQ